MLQPELRKGKTNRKRCCADILAQQPDNILSDAFNGLNQHMAAQIVHKKLDELKAMLAKKNVEFSADAAAEKLIKKKGISTEFGAREIGRVIQSEIKPLLVDEILFGALKEGGVCRLTAADGRFAADFNL